jgi:hypothetical protein
MAPLLGGSGASGDGDFVGSVGRVLRKKWPPARLRASDSER